MNLLKISLYNMAGSDFEPGRIERIKEKIRNCIFSHELSITDREFFFVFHEIDPTILSEKAKIVVVIDVLSLDEGKEFPVESKKKLVSGIDCDLLSEKRDDCISATKALISLASSSIRTLLRSPLRIERSE